MACGSATSGPTSKASAPRRDRPAWLIEFQGADAKGHGSPANAAATAQPCVRSKLLHEVDEGLDAGQRHRVEGGAHAAHRAVAGQVGEAGGLGLGDELLSRSGALMRNGTFIHERYAGSTGLE